MLIIDLINMRGECRNTVALFKDADRMYLSEQLASFNFLS